MVKNIIIAIIAIVMTTIANSASAEIGITMPTREETARIVIEAIPIASPAEIDKCYEAIRNDGFYKIYSSKVRIVCTKNEITRVWAQ